MILFPKQILETFGTVVMKVPCLLKKKKEKKKKFDTFKYIENGMTFEAVF